MIREEYVTIEAAKLLKKAGFPQYEDNGIGEGLSYANGVLGDYLRTKYDTGDYIAAPSQAQAMRWLREEKRIHSEIRYRIYKHNWDCLLRDMNGKVAIPQESLNYVRNLQDFWVTFSTYEAAAEAGIQAACKYIIENQKEL